MTEEELKQSVERARQYVEEDDIKAASNELSNSLSLTDDPDIKKEIVNALIELAEDGYNNKKK